ncbi:MAG TPA: hypothetical protein VGQ83_01185 [Polyangia bacterium]|jgi:hypothetical protein
MRVVLALTITAALMAVGGCKSETSCKASLGSGGASAPCLNNVGTDPDGGAMATPECYAKAEICPGKGGFPFCERARGSSNRDSVELQNRGQTPLTITAIRTRGDDRCAFIDPQLGSSDGGVPVTIGPDETVLFSFRFVPPEVGQYNALIELETNAENYPVLRIPVCGIGISPDAGVNPRDDAGVQTCGLPQCEDKSSADFSNCWGGWGQ